MTEELLTLSEIAKLYRVTYRYARDCLVKKPGFPRPAPGSTRKNPLWHRDVIRDYLRSQPA